MAGEAVAEEFGDRQRVAQRLGLAAQARGDKIVLLVGDLPFFGPLGFEVTPRDQVRLPGPVNPYRILWRALTPGAFEGVAGAVALPKA